MHDDDVMTDIVGVCCGEQKTKQRFDGWLRNGRSISR